MSRDELAALCGLYEMQLAAERDRVWRWRITSAVLLVMVMALL